jgi:hypothetical protein
MTLQEKLTNVQAAIAAAELSQSYSINGRANTRANLAVLYAREKELETAIARQSSTGTCPVASFRRPD